MDGNHSNIEGNHLSRAGGGVQPPRLSPLSEEAPASVQSALREVRPDDLDAIFDGALFGPPALEVSPEVSAAGVEVPTPVPVGAVDWYVERHAQPAGPFRLERLRELWHQGELNPDTLFWCEAWSSWRALSRVPELVAALTISGLPTVAADASVSTAPARPKEVDSGKKVVSALHSLVEEEVVWLRKMKEDKEQEKEEEARAAMLEVPIAPVVPPAPVPAPVPVLQPVVAPVPVQGTPVAPYPGFVAPVAPPVIPGMMAAPPAPEAPAPAQRGKALLAGVLIGSAAVGLVAGGLLLLSQSRGAAEPVSPRPVVSTETAPRQEAPAVVQPAAPAPVAVAPPVVSAPVTPAPAAQAPAPQAPAAAPVAVAPVTPAPVKPAAPAVTPAPEKPVTKTVAPVVVPEKPKPVVAPAVSLEPKAGVGKRVPEERVPAAPTSARKAANDPLNFDDALDKKFEEELGLSEGAPKFKAEDPRSKRHVYIPPEPGKELPESLSTSDVVQVVGSHKDAILACIQTHSPARMSDSGKDRFVVRWRVLPTGDAVEALMETEALKGTPFARCIEGQVRSWKFPQHRVQSREPVRFPFTY
ncbi:GYF domain-containing protein [Archangium gephyra]|uniref:GYF domain-containing protein n=1 Tax=Archangium gephyra TaxID=48 RepID=UPI0035D3EA0E